MALKYAAGPPPTFSNPYLSSLVGPTVYYPANLTSPLTYVLQGRAGSTGFNGLGGIDWIAAGAATAFVNAVATWTAVCSIPIKAYPFYYNGSGDTQANWIEKLDHLGADSTELGRHELPSSTVFGYQIQLTGSFNKQNSIFTMENNAVGGFNFVTFMHEIGHALGLVHPHENNPFPGVSHSDEIGDFGLNQSVFTVMSYNDGYEANGYAPSFAYGWMTTPGAFDIAAVQALYGANMSTKVGADVYLLPTANNAGTGYACIWDAGGGDTISGAGASASCIIDLREATLAHEAGGGGWLSSVQGIFGGFTIANGAKIENALGGDFADQITGNSLANSVSGMGGNDTIYGQDGNDTLNGGGGDDVIVGGYGEDALYGEDGVDVLFGEFGNDMLVAGFGNDRLYGQDGHDVVFGEGGQDLIVAGFGDDTLYGQNGDDILFGEFNNDLLGGGGGSDTLFGQEGNDTLFGEADNDTASGGLGNDRVYGQDGDDTLLGDEGNDTLDGGGGNDFLASGAGADQLNGGGGGDYFYSAATAEQADFIADFNEAEGDRIVVLASAFAAPIGFQLTDGIGFLAGPGSRPVAQTATFYFDTSTKALWYDVDGTGPGSANVIDFLLNTPTLHASDFLFI